MSPRAYRRDHLEKRCEHPRPKWGRCACPWWFVCAALKTRYRFSLDKYLGRHVETFEQARDAANLIWLDIRAGRFRGPQAQPVAASRGPMTFRDFATLWQTRKGDLMVSGRIHKYRLGTICRFVRPGTDPPVTIGETALDALTLLDVEDFAAARTHAGKSPTAVNHDLRLLRAMFNWATLKGLVERTPFRVGNVAALKLAKETPRSRRFETAEDEERLLAASDPYMHAFTAALIDMASRPSEVRTLQWKNVNLQRRTWVIEAKKEKTRTERSGMLSTRLRLLLELRQYDPAGTPWPPEAYVFGDELGRVVALATIRDRWRALVARVGLEGLQMRDLRHEGANQYEESGTPVSDVSQLLGHTSLATTSRYLRNKRRRMAQLAVDRLDHARAEAAQAKALAAEAETADDPPPDRPTRAPSH
jgi:integrase